jgi:cytoskeletal protein CcmA (bactofilin family)
MALFNSKEPEKTAKPSSTTSTQPITATAAPAHDDRGVYGKAVAASASAPAAQSAGEGRAYLDRGSRINGKLSFDGPARIDGTVEGEINAKDSLMIGETAVVTAQVRAASIVVAGKVNGDLSASSRIEIRPSAKVLGNLTVPVLVVHEGALFEGHCSMQPEGAREDRKITVVPKEERVVQAVAGPKPA